MKRSSLLIGSLCFLFIISPSFAMTCPPVEEINSALKETAPVFYANSRVSKLRGVFYQTKTEKKTAPVFNANNMVSKLQGVFYQTKTEDVEKTSLTCIYKLEDDTYFNLNLRDADAYTVDINKFDQKYWGFDDRTGLYYCENNRAGVTVENCAFTLNTK